MNLQELDINQLYDMLDQTSDKQEIEAIRNEIIYRILWPVIKLTGFFLCK